MIGQHKIIFTGPVGAGKTTAIGAVSDIEPISTEQFASDDTRQRKPLTTVAMDYGSLRLDTGETVHLYGTPGQERFDFMWELLVEGSIGIVILVDHSGPQPLVDLRSFLDSFSGFIDNHALAVGVSHLEQEPPSVLENYRALLAGLDLNVPVFEIDARRHDDVILLVQSLLYSIDPGLEQAPPPDPSTEES